jgi:glyoxylase I family protein
MTHFHYVALSCKDPAAVEQFYVRHFGFRRARLVVVNDRTQTVFLKAGPMDLEPFRTDAPDPAGPPARRRATATPRPASATWRSWSTTLTPRSPR